MSSTHYRASHPHPDVAWDVMREYVRSQYIEQFRRYEEWFNTGAIPQEYARGLHSIWL